MIQTHVMTDTTVGPLTLQADSTGLCRLDFGLRAAPTPGPPASPILQACVEQLEAYFAGRLYHFDLPLNPVGTHFQGEVWTALQQIPYGQVRSYGDIARAIEHPKAFRAVGMANNRNPISIIIPCHRVVGSNGEMTGYGGGLDIKIRLLTLERIPLTEAGSLEQYRVQLPQPSEVTP